MRCSRPGFVGSSWCWLALRGMLQCSNLYHCFSWHLVHLTSFCPVSFSCLPPHERQATRSAIVWPVRGAAGSFAIEWRIWMTSRGERVEGRRRTWNSGSRLTSMKFQRSRKLIIELRVGSSTPEAAPSSVLDSHRPSLRTSHTPSKVNSHAASDLTGG
jgi:hypothetical protein